MGIEATLTLGDISGPFDLFYKGSVQSMERGALRATDRAGRLGERAIRDAMGNASLGRLGNAIKAESDLQSGRGVKRYGSDGFSASSTIAIRSGSERTRGAIEAYIEGADIAPVKGQWLWIATDEIPRVTGRYRMTPALWHANGFDTKIGPLVLVHSVNGYPLLVVKNASVNAAGRPRGAKALTRNGRVRKGQRGKEFIVAFIGIPRTSRAARLDVSALLSAVLQQLPALWEQEMGKEGKSR